MKIIRSQIIIFLTVAIGSLALLVACQSEPDAAEPTATASVPSATIPTPTTVVETAVSQPAETEVLADQCIVCHTDKQMLIDTAKPEEEVISENEGAG